MADAKQANPVECLISGNRTSGSVAVFRETTEPGRSLPLHSHLRQDKIFHVIRGRHRFLVESREIEAGPGEVVFVRRNRVHGYENLSGEPGILHFELLPADTSESFYRELPHALKNDDDPGQVFTRHSIRLHGPPPQAYP